FHCDAHPYQMQGTIEVIDPNAPPPTTPPPSTTAPPPGGGAGGSGGSGSPGEPAPGGSTGSSGTLRLRVAREQVGAVLRGRVSTVAGARILITALASNRALAQRPPRHLRKVR